MENKIYKKNLRIFNIMMSRDLGGIQQSYVDYSEALLEECHKVISIASINAQINHYFKPNHELPNFTPWCILSRIHLSILIAEYKPDIIICHGNRAIRFTCDNILRPQYTRIIGVAHNYSYKQLKKCDFIITLSQDLRTNLINHNFSKNQIIPLSNMIKITKLYNPLTYHNPVTIGSLGRLVHKKGFIYLINSIKLIKDLGYNIRLIIGGNGTDKNYLKQLIHQLNLSKEIKLIGWVKNKEKFFKEIDIFCLPSIKEPFGIILLEAIMYSKPIVATKSGGPQEILRHNLDGFIVRTHSAQDLAKYITIMINNPILAHSMSKSAYNRIKNQYSRSIVKLKLSNALNTLYNFKTINSLHNI